MSLISPSKVIIRRLPGLICPFVSGVHSQKPGFDSQSPTVPALSADHLARSPTVLALRPPVPVPCRLFLFPFFIFINYILKCPAYFSACYWGPIVGCFTGEREEVMPCPKAEERNDRRAYNPVMRRLFCLHKFFALLL
jgi:hypothetical protein